MNRRRQQSSKGKQARGNTGGWPMIYVTPRLMRDTSSRVGSGAAREYCSRCGQKRRVCECGLPTMDA